MLLMAIMMRNQNRLKTWSNTVTEREEQEKINAEGPIPAR